MSGLLKTAGNVASRTAKNMFLSQSDPGNAKDYFFVDIVAQRAGSLVLGVDSEDVRSA